jgi:hypothetical protein
MPEAMGTAFSGVNFALCGCCVDHDPDGPLEFSVVTCMECGGQCSCIGCVAEADARAAIERRQ